MLCLAGCLAACVTAVSAIAARPASGQRTTRVMTCNVRITGLPEDDTAGRRWEDRREVCLKAIRMYRPDVICMQEVIYDSYNYFKEKFSDYVAYGFAGPEMDPYTEGYHFIGKNVIFFSKKRYEFVSSGCYWLSETPLAAGSCSWNTMRARHCNWVRLRDRKSGAEFRVLDIHLDHKSDDARREQMKMIVGECARSMPTASRRSSAAISIRESKMRPSRACATPDGRRRTKPYTVPAKRASPIMGSKARITEKRTRAASTLSSCAATCNPFRRRFSATRSMVCTPATTTF